MQDAVKVMAKSLVRNRHAVTKMYGLKSQLQAVSLRIQVKPSGFAAELLLALTILVLLTADAMSPADSQVHSSHG